jgi:hypothetical protein
MFYLGGALLTLTIYGVVLMAAERLYLSTLSVAAGALVSLAGGVVLVQADASLEAFGWLFAAGQAVTLICVSASVEWTVRRASPAS